MMKTPTTSATAFTAHVPEPVPELTVVPIRPNTEATRGCHDWPFALLFFINVAAIGGALVHWGLDTVRVNQPPPLLHDPSKATSQNDGFTTANDARTLAYIALAMATLALVLSLVLTVLVSIYTLPMMWILHWTAVAIALAATVAGCIMKSVTFILVGLVVTIGFALYTFVLADELAFVAVNVRVASTAIARHWSAYVVAVLVTVAQTAWIILFLLVVLGVAQATTADTNTTASSSLKPRGETCTENAECASNWCRYGYGDVVWISKKHCAFSFPGLEHVTTATYAALACLFVSLYWGLQVLHHISNTTACGTVAAFWYGAESKFTTGAALCRSLTTSFGSICFGSLVGAFVEVMRQLADLARLDGSVFGCLVECLLGCISDFIATINHWAYVYVAMYGFKLTHAGRAVLDLFSERQFSRATHNDSLAIALSIAAFSIGLVCAGAGAYIAKLTDLVTFSNSSYFLSIMGFCIGVGIAITPLSVLNCAVSTILVCFAEDPAAFAVSHSDLYLVLVDGWHDIYPGMLLAAGYSTTNQIPFTTAVR